MNKIGIYGGSFDPVHLAHEWIAHRALKEGVDRLIIFPCLISPHKLEQQPRSSAEDRLGMLSVAFSTSPSIEISDWEIRKESISYTWETVDYLRLREPNAKIVLILGGDQFAVIESWGRFSDWAYEVEFLVFPRKGEGNQFEKQSGLGLNFRVMEDFPPEISSSQIRKAIHENGPWEKWVSPEVRKWILSHELY